MRLVHFIYYFSLFLFRSILRYPSTTKAVRRFLHAYQTKNQGKFDARLIKDVIKRHSIQQLFINDTFAALYGRSSTEDEQQRNILFTLMSCLYDTIMDEERMTAAALDAMLADPQAYQPTDFYGTALKDVYLSLLSIISSKEDFKKVIREVHYAQLTSLNQKDPSLSMDDILDITCRKGGYSLLAAQYLFDLSFDEATSNTWYALGAVIQMMDDLYDIHEDLQQGIRTFSNASSSFSFIQETYNTQVSQLCAAVGGIGIPGFRRKRFWVSLSIIPALGYVALHQLGLHLKGDDRLPDLRHVPRKSLITDMEKISNVFRLIRYCYTVTKIYGKKGT